MVNEEKIKSLYKDGMVNLDSIFDQELLRDLVVAKNNIFKEYPYLYYGTMAAEKNYMMLYTTDAKATLALAYDDNKIIGISTGIPLLSNADIINDCPNFFVI